MHPARRQVVFLLAAIAALAAVLALVLPAGPSSAATVSAAGNGVGASHSQTILPVGVLRPVSAGEGGCEAPLQARIVVGACVAAEEGGDLTPVFRVEGRAMPAWISVLVGRDQVVDLVRGCGDVGQAGDPFADVVGGGLAGEPDMDGPPGQRLEADRSGSHWMRTELASFRSARCWLA